jgi:carotenoid cleavage dioxygenase
MIHDIAITPRYSLILDMPVTASLERMMNGGRLFDWEPSNGARIGVMPRYGTGADVKWFDVDVGYVFHVFNAWEEGDEIVLDACLTPRTSILAETEGDRDAERARMHRWRLNRTTGNVTEGRVSDIPLDFSRVNENYIGVKTRYGYASRSLWLGCPVDESKAEAKVQDGVLRLTLPKRTATSRPRVVSSMPLECTSQPTTSTRSNCRARTKLSAAASAKRNPLH